MGSMKLKMKVENLLIPTIFNPYWSKENNIVEVLMDPNLEGKSMSAKSTFIDWTQYWFWFILGFQDMLQIFLNIWRT